MSEQISGGEEPKRIVVAVAHPRLNSFVSSDRKMIPSPFVGDIRPGRSYEDQAKILVSHQAGLYTDVAPSPHIQLDDEIAEQFPEIKAGYLLNVRPETSSEKLRKLRLFQWSAAQVAISHEMRAIDGWQKLEKGQRGYTDARRRALNVHLMQSILNKNR